jgi:hypothetical protein
MQAILDQQVRYLYDTAWYSNPATPATAHLLWNLI